MRDRRVERLIDRLVRDARIPSSRRREDLRRELEAHFEDAGEGDDAVRRFGDPELLARSWHPVYRGERTIVYAAKLLLSIAMSLGAAMAIALAVAVPAGGFSYRAAPAAIFVLMLVIVRETTRPFSGSRIVSRLRAFATTTGAAKLLQMFAVLLMTEYALHARHGVNLGVERLLLAAAVLAAVWAATVAIATRVDRFFGQTFMIV